MQARKLVRLINEEIKKNPKVAYMDVVTDRRFIENQYSDFRYLSLDDIEVHDCVWNAEDSVNENWRNVLVLGNE